MRYAQIIDGVVHGIFEYVELPAFASNIKMIDITARNDIEIGMKYLTDGTFDTTVAPEAVKTLVELQGEKLASLKSWHDAQVKAMKQDYSDAEIESFLDKRNEAMAYTADNTVATPYLLALVGGDVTLVPGLVDSIMAKVTAIGNLEGQVSAKRDAIKVATTQAQLDAVTI